MPELPEVQHVIETLTPRVVGRTVRSVLLNRPQIIHGSTRPSALLRACRITGMHRHGKQLALLGACRNRHPCICIHLGMTGSLRYLPTPARPPANHTHVIWRFDDGSSLAFRDPRRFGGIWTYPDRSQLWADRWQHLGADASRIKPAELLRIFSRTSRNLKSALLDQRCIAGLGNIYVDELLFACRLHPLTPCNMVNRPQVVGLVRRMRHMLRRAIKAGGSTFRDYVDGTGVPGRFQRRHRVYGRSNQPCVTCSQSLSTMKIAGRTTIFCENCQRAIYPLPMNKEILHHSHSKPMAVCG